MKISEFIKKKLEELFLYSKVTNTNNYQDLLDEHFNGVAKVINQEENHIIISTKFDDVTFSYKMNIVNGVSFEKISSVEIIEECFK